MASEEGERTVVRYVVKCFSQRSSLPTKVSLSQLGNEEETRRANERARARGEGKARSVLLLAWISLPVSRSKKTRRRETEKRSERGRGGVEVALITSLFTTPSCLFLVGLAAGQNK